jgi:hypothetical protein
MDESSPIKDLLYQTLQSIPENVIQKKIAKNPRNLIEEIFSKADIDSLGKNKTENYETFAESLMHYLLTSALIPSQRKVAIGHIEIDIVIPDVRTLKSSNKDAIIILFPKTDNTITILQKLEKISTVQPNRENIWLVQRIALGLPYKTYEIDNNHSFFDIMSDIKLSGKTQSKFKIFKV